MNRFLPNTVLTDEFGVKHNIHNLIKDRTVIINMFYSNCKVKCVPLGKLMQRVNKLLNNYIEKENIHFISITLDAANDTPKNLMNFKNNVYEDVCKNWHFYTGNPEDIEKLRFKLGMYSPEPEIDLVKANHSGHFIIFNKLGFVKHTESFDNPVDIARKIVQLLPDNYRSHSYGNYVTNLNYDAITEEEIFENIQTMNSMFTVPFLPDNLKKLYEEYGEKQRGFQYNPIKKPASCCCSKKNLS